MTVGSFGIRNVKDVPNRKLHDKEMGCRSLFIPKEEHDIKDYFWKLKGGEGIVYSKYLFEKAPV